VLAGLVHRGWDGEQVQQQGRPLIRDGWVRRISLAEGPENGAEQLRLLVLSPRPRSGAAVAAAAHRIEEAVGEVLLVRVGESRVVGGVAPAVAHQAPIIHVDIGV
jgi:hypothetical protein